MNPRDMIIFEEGLKYEAYPCTAGHTTIGIGFNVDAHQEVLKQLIHRTIHIGDKISSGEIEILYDYAMNEVVTNLRKTISGYDSYPERYQLALINLCYNLGINGLMNFRHMLYFMTQHNDDGVVAELLASHYATQLPERTARIIQLIRGNIPKEYL